MGTPEGGSARDYDSVCRESLLRYRAPQTASIEACATRITFASNPNLFEGENTALPAQIFRNASQPFAGAQERAWGAALTLVVIVLTCTVIARLVASRFAIKER